jgi:type VI secretion system VasD/TssJ family lipoprotein
MSLAAIEPVPLLRSAALLLSLVLVACGGTPKPAAFCMDIQASPDLNLYDGQPHVVVLYVFPLKSQSDFQRLTADELLGGVTAPGIDPPRQITVAPGQRVPFEETLPPMTTQVGLVADYYRRPGDPEGTRRAVVAADCAMFGRTSVTLSAREMAVQ